MHGTSKRSLISVTDKSQVSFQVELMGREVVPTDLKKLKGTSSLPIQSVWRKLEPNFGSVQVYLPIENRSTLQIPVEVSTC